jgi:hypothetical protein
LAAVIGSVDGANVGCHGRSRVPDPKMSKPSHHPIGVVPVERQRIVAVRTLEPDRFLDIGEELGHVVAP